MNIRGLRSGQLTAVEPTFEYSEEGHHIWVCRCNCGQYREIRGSWITQGIAKSCGCIRRRDGDRSPAHHFYVARYYAKRLNRYPQWADEAAIRQVYEECPPECQVDHIIPLRGELVSGLHVAENLQYLSAVENACKSNAFLPTH